MFADPKNPLTADLIKEFKSVSRPNQQSQTKSSKECYATESASKIVLSRIRTNTLNKGTSQVDLSNKEVDQTKSSNECYATESSSNLVLSRIRANTLSRGTSQADSRDEIVGNIHEISKSDFFSAVNLAVVSSPTLRKEPQLPAKSSKGRRFNKFLTLKSKSKPVAPPVERNKNELRTKSLSGLVDDHLTKCKDNFRLMGFRF